jgi:hypothetical protein
MSNPVQDWMLNVAGVGTTDATIAAYRKSPPAIQPTVDDLGKYEQNGRPITVLPHPPQEYIWH